ncbi:MAG: acyl-CoA dehydrogenase [Bacilli bacterium]|nr:acyl-CoA dehydrogenase [Bacilli bacterium]
MVKHRGGAFIIQPTPAEDVFTPEDFTEEHRMIAQTTRDFVAGEVSPHAEAIEQLNLELTVKLLKQAGELGLLAADVPEEFDGLGLDTISSTLIGEHMAAAGSLALSHGAHVGIGTLPIVYFGTQQQRSKYLPKLASGEWLAAYCLTEPGSGSDALGAKTAAKLSADGNHYVLNGTKQFITNAGFADVFIVYAKVDGEKFSTFIVERGTPGVSTGAEEKKMGLKGSSTRQLILEDAAVPVENLLGEVGRGHVIAFNILNIGRYKLAAGCVGSSKIVIELAVKYANQRVQFGRPIAAFPLIGAKLADMNTRTFALESMVYRTGGLLEQAFSEVQEWGDAGRTLAKAVEEYALECSINKVFGSEVFDFVVDEGLQIHGGVGYMQEYPIERLYRDSRIHRIFEGTNEINRLLIPGTLLRKAMKGELPLLAATQSLQEELLGSIVAPRSDEPLAEEGHLLQLEKKIFLFTGGLAVQTYQNRLEGEQEILAKLADLMIDIYAGESILLRTQKALAKGEPNPAFKIKMTEVFIGDSFNRIESQARDILTAISSGDELRTQLALLKKLTRFVPKNLVEKKRELAKAICAAERYVC